jgi:hypothetical protein
LSWLCRGKDFCSFDGRLLLTTDFWSFFSFFNPLYFSSKIGIIISSYNDPTFDEAQKAIC